LFLALDHIGDTPGIAILSFEAYQQSNTYSLLTTKGFMFASSGLMIAVDKIIMRGLTRFIDKYTKMFASSGLMIVNLIFKIKKWIYVCFFRIDDCC
jgi:hypothetical protein